MASGRKRALHAAVELLAGFVEENRVDEGVYTRMCKVLKDAHDAPDLRRDENRTQLAIEYAVQSPPTLVYAPGDVDVRSKGFLCALLASRRAYDAEGDDEDEDVYDGISFATWCKQTVAFYLYDADFTHQDEDYVYSSDNVFRTDAIEMLLQVSERYFGDDVRAYLMDDLAEAWAPCDMLDESTTKRLQRLSRRYPRVLKAWMERCDAEACPRCMHS